MFALRLTIIVVLFVTLLQSCGGPRYGAPVDSRSQPPSIKIGYHIVSKGETLYSIAWRYGLDYKQLARVNGISTSSYAIYPGQKLNLNTRGSTKKAAYKPLVKTVSSSSTRSTKSSRSSSSNANKHTPASSIRKSTAKKVASSKPVNQVVTHGSLKWQWPAKGTVIKVFSGATSTNKGINIKGRVGDSVYAAASGKVVYAGSGLAGYGKLIIIKHNESYLSAYAHNRKLLVGEGDQVGRGKKIGEIGSNNGQSILHFEIRLNGKPVNPQSYLPR